MAYNLCAEEIRTIMTAASSISRWRDGWAMTRDLLRMMPQAAWRRALPGGLTEMSVSAAWLTRLSFRSIFWRRHLSLLRNAGLSGDVYR